MNNLKMIIFRAKKNLGFSVLFLFTSLTKVQTINIFYPHLKKKKKSQDISLVSGNLGLPLNNIVDFLLQIDNPTLPPFSLTCTQHTLLNPFLSHHL